MQPNPPFWFKQRQAKAEPVESNPTTLRLTAPILPEAFISIREGEDGHWKAGLRLRLDEPDVASTEPEFDTPTDAWAAAFELYRNHVIV
jgi:hypothetical protein